MPIKLNKLKRRDRQRIERMQKMLEASRVQKKLEMLEHPHPLLAGFSLNISEQEVDHVKELNPTLKNKNSRALNLLGPKRDLDIMPDIKPPTFNPNANSGENY